MGFPGWVGVEGAWAGSASVQLHRTGQDSFQAVLGAHCAQTLLEGLLSLRRGLPKESTGEYTLLWGVQTSPTPRLFLRSFGLRLECSLEGQTTN